MNTERKAETRIQMLEDIKAKPIVEHATFLFRSLALEEWVREVTQRSDSGQ